MAKRQSGDNVSILVQKKMEKILPQHNGVRAIRLQEMIAKELPGEKAIGSWFSYITKKNPLKFARTRVQGKGVFYSWVGKPTEAKPQKESQKENVYYAPFAKYIQEADKKSSDNENSQNLGECSVAIPWGDKGARSPLGKWATPDVIGIFKPEHRAAIDFPVEIVSVEIKAVSDAARILEGFGQACAYRLFSHKVYLVVPDDDSLFLARLEAMCHLMGLGLVVFDTDAEEIDSSIFSVRLRARKQEPDTAYVNQAMPDEIIKKLYK